MSWFHVRVESAGHRDAAMAALFAAGAQGVQEEGTVLSTSFPDEAAARAATAAVRGVDPAASCDIRVAPEVDWTSSWRDHARLVTLGSLRIAPPWLAAGHDPRTTVVIEPGMAFGTGDHATTRGAVVLLQDVVRPGTAVADLGSGSAVLSIAAAKLGADPVWAIEIDGEAQANAADNVDRNDVGEVVQLLQGDAAVLLPIVAPVDVVVANIISSVIVELLPAIGEAVRPGGSAVLAGILEEQRPAMTNAMQAEGWEIRRTLVEEEWWSVLVQRR